MQRMGTGSSTLLHCRLERRSNMSANVSQVPLLAMLICATTIAAAEAQAPAEPPGRPANQPHAQYNPNRGVLQRYLTQASDVRIAFQQKPELSAAFAFTDDQASQFAQSVQTINPEGQQQEMRQKVQDPNVTPEQKQKLYQEFNEKRRTMEQEIAKKLDEVMTPEQKSLRQKIADASKAAEQAMKTALDQSLNQALSAEEKQRMQAATHRWQPQGAPPKPAGQ